MAHNKLNKNNAKEASMPVSKPTGSRWQLFVLAGSIMLLTVFSFSPVFNNSFINQDDDIYVFNNTDISKPLPEAIAWFFGPHYYSGNYVPLTMTAYALAYRQGGALPDFYHALSIVIHLANVLLIFWFIYLLSGKKRSVAAIVALFFGIHPMHVESVAWAAELKDVLYTFFFMAGLIAYYKYNQLVIEKLNLPPAPDPKNTEGNAPIATSYRLLIIAFTFFVCSVLSKPAGIIFPLVLLLVDYYTRRKFDKVVWLEKLPFFIVTVIFGFIAVKAQSSAELINDHYPFYQRLLFAGYAVPAYLIKFLWPVDLSNFYPYPEVINGHFPYIYYIALVADVAILYAVYRTLKYSRLIAFGGLFFLVNLLLVLQFVSFGNAIIADRYTYVPYIGLLFIIAMGFDQIYYNSREQLKKYKPYAVTLIIALALTCSYLTYARCKVWESQDTISIDLLINFPDNAIVLNNRGYLLYIEGNYDESVKLFKKAIAQRPDYVKVDYVKAYINLWNCYIAMKDYSSAEKVTEDAIKYAPDDPSILNIKACMLCIQGKNAEAIPLFKEALSRKKDDINIYMNLSRCYFDLHDYQNWANTSDSGLKYIPHNPLLLNNKGYSLFLKGDYNNALTYFKAALDIKPGFETAMANVSNCNHAIDSIRAAKGK